MSGADIAIPGESAKLMDELARTFASSTDPVPQRYMQLLRAMHAVYRMDREQPPIPADDNTELERIAERYMDDDGENAFDLALDEAYHVGCRRSAREASS
jgi:hypothetical protein